MKSNKRLLSGFQDFLPDKMLARNALITSIKEVYELFGFLPQDTPVLEYASLLKGKYGEDEKLIYEFIDRGKRHVAMRYDFTVPLSRIVGMYGGRMIFPYRRYQYGMVWRADKPGKGRYREFMQIDADLIGDNSIVSDAEMIFLTAEIMNRLKIRSEIRFNSREILSALVRTCSIDDKSGASLLRVIDKIDKISLEGVLSELNELGFSEKIVQLVNSYLSFSGTSQEMLNNLRNFFGHNNEFSSCYNSLKGLIDLLSNSVNSYVEFKFDPTIARGLDYYTGIIFETTFLDDPTYGSICSGGRYDSLIKAPNGDFIPAIGISIGLDRLFSAMESVGSLKLIQTTTKVFIISLADIAPVDCFLLANELRRVGICTELSLGKKNMSKQMKSANLKSIPWVAIIGPDELKKGTVTIKNMITGDQKTLSRKEAIITIKKSQ